MGLPSAYIATLGLPVVSGILNSSFGLASNHGYYVGSADLVNKTLTLPPTPAQEDRIEIYGVGFGSDLMTIDGNGNNVNWGSLSLGGPPFVVAVRGAHLYLVFNAGDNTWTVASDTVGSKFASNGTPIANTIIYSDQNGFSDINVIGDDSYVGRANGNVIRSIYNATKVLTTPKTMSSATLTDVPGLTFALPSGGGTPYSFDFELGLTKAGGAGIVGVSVAYSGSATSILQTVVLAQSASVATFGGTTTASTTVDDSGARANGGPFLAKITGAVVAGSAGNITIQVRVAAGTVDVNTASWGRVWESTGV